MFPSCLRSLRRAVSSLVLLALPLASAHAAGIAQRVPELSWLLLAPPGGSELRVLDLSRGAVTPLGTLRHRGRGPVVAVHFQMEGRRVWVLGKQGLDVHEAYSGRLLAHWDGPPGVSLERLEVPARGRPRVSGVASEYEAVVGAPFLVLTRVSLR